jgi:hypothetical protein
MNRISELGTWQERQRGFLAMELDSSVLRPPEQYAQHDKGVMGAGFPIRPGMTIKDMLPVAIGFQLYTLIMYILSESNIF